MQSASPSQAPSVNPLGYRQDVHLTEFIKQHKFTLSAEVIPPRNGAAQSELFTQIKDLYEAGAQFFSVTKGAGGSLRGGSLPIAQAIKDHFGVPSIAHFTCRDLTPQEVENQLMDHDLFGIRNVLALRGDPPEGDPNWVARDGGYNYAYQLIEQIQGLNEGRFLARTGEGQRAGTRITDFCIGAAAYPEHPDPEDRIRFFVRKVQAGASFGITQMIYDPDAYLSFLEGLAKHGVVMPILPGTRVLKSQAHARRISQRFGCSVPNWLLDRLPVADPPSGTRVDHATSLNGKDQATSPQQDPFSAQILDAFEELVERLRRAGAPGLHLYLIADSAGSTGALRRLESLVKRGS